MLQNVCQINVICPSPELGLYYTDFFILQTFSVTNVLLYVAF